jgi:hypothetical protein
MCVVRGPDGGVADAAMDDDAGSADAGVDAGRRDDAAARDGGANDGGANDGGAIANVDGGSPSAPEVGGCGCSVPGGTRARVPLSCVLLGLVLFGRRRAMGGRARRAASTPGAPRSISRG